MIDATVADDGSSHSKTVEEFQYLLEKSSQLFAGLRDLSPVGKNWAPYFQRTFEVYTKLWKFQQTHRVVLEKKDTYGLKRWEIGEIASKIGQLFYHYYLRTSETNYLHESFVFYQAILERRYFDEMGGLNQPSLVIKKLRYYARFIVVCLLLNRRDVIAGLLEGLKSLVSDYTSEFKPSDSAEWDVVLSEISTFLDAEKKLNPTDRQGNLLTVPTRLQIERSPKLDKDGHPKLKLQEVILVGNYQNQIKFSELTLDMYRMLQSLEREPILPKSSTLNPNPQPPTLTSEDQEGGATTNAPEPSELVVQSKEETKEGTRRTNPHKYLLYRPTFAQLMTYISSAFKDISDNSVLLLYISADGLKRSDDKTLQYIGGVATAVNQVKKADEGVMHCLHPEDLIPWTRKPFFLIVDSNNSIAFNRIPKTFSSPLGVLMSPTEYPPSIKDTTQIGSLFSLFLHAPIKAFAFVSDAAEMDAEIWAACGEVLGGLEATVLGMLSESEELDGAYKRFLQDDFLSKFLVRFVICQAILRAHSAFKEVTNFPTSHPALPLIHEKPEIAAKIQALVNIAKVAAHYEAA